MGKLLYEIGSLRSERKQIAQERDEKKGKEIRERLKLLTVRQQEIQQELTEGLLLVPMPPASNVPEGFSEKENQEIKKWGKIPEYNFPQKSYLSLMQKLDLIDIQRGSKISGFRGYILKNEAVILQEALLRWSLDFLKKKGFTLIMPTTMVKEFAMVGSGMFPHGKEDVYRVQDDLFLSGTTEVPLMALHQGEILSNDRLPILYAGISSAFRREAGTYGAKDPTGIFRVHEFRQTEQVVICKNDPGESKKWHEILLKNSEEMMQSLNLPYRVVNVCAGELSPGQVARYDIEAWIPSLERYRETHSDSYLLDYQTWRLGIRYKDARGKIKFPHSLNNTGLALPRILIPLLENHQCSDRSVNIPSILHTYTNFEKIYPKN